MAKAVTGAHWNGYHFFGLKRKEVRNESHERTSPQDTDRTHQMRCAIYTRKSTEEGLDQEFNSLDAQRESGEAYIRVSSTKAGSASPTATTTAASPAATWTGRHCSG